MPARLLFPDPQSAADALTFAGRAARNGEDAVRFHAAGGVVALTAGILSPRGFGDPTPTVLAMRTLGIDPELECDLVVTASALEIAPDDDGAIVLPETALAPAWAGVTPPRSGWHPHSVIDASVLAARAQSGIHQVAETVPTDSGEDIVRMVRAAVWGAPDAELAGLPLGTAFAALGMGFINGAEEARVLSSGPWTRVALARGHVIVRGPAVSGLTAVRRTGATG